MRIAQLLLVVSMLALSRVGHAQTLVVIVNPASAVRTLARNQALDIFLGRLREFSNGVAALPIDLAPGTPERRLFYVLLAHKEPADMSSYWARLVFSGQTTPPYQAADARRALDLVASNPNAIAYVDRAAVDGRVRIVLELTP